MSVALLTGLAQRDDAETVQLAKLNEVINMLGTHEALSVARFVEVGPAAARADDAVHALYDDTTAAFPGPFTDPDVPRNVTVTFTASWNGGDITVTGTDQFDQPVSEVIPDTAASTVAGVKIFKTVTGATKETPAGVGGNGASIGVGDILGLPLELADEVGMGFVAAVPEVVTLDTDYHSAEPDTAPSATTYRFLVNAVLLP